MQTLIIAFKIQQHFFQSYLKVLFTNSYRTWMNTIPCNFPNFRQQTPYNTASEPSMVTCNQPCQFSNWSSALCTHLEDMQTIVFRVWSQAMILRHITATCICNNALLSDRKLHHLDLQNICSMQVNLF